MSSETPAADPWFLYLIEQASGKLYTGITRDVQRRFKEHQANNGKTARSLRGKGPLKLVFFCLAGNQSEALKLEHLVKKLPRYKKLQLIKGDFDISSLHNSQPSSKKT